MLEAKFEVKFVFYSNIFHKTTRKSMVLVVTCFFFSFKYPYSNFGAYICFVGIFQNVNNVAYCCEKKVKK